jgi:hypothetical protein
VVCSFEGKSKKKKKKKKKVNKLRKIVKKVTQNKTYVKQTTNKHTTQERGLSRGILYENLGQYISPLTVLTFSLLKSNQILPKIQSNLFLDDKPSVAWNCNIIYLFMLFIYLRLLIFVLFCLFIYLCYCFICCFVLFLLK